MNKQKPVWRMNAGRGVPSDLGNQSMYGDYVVLETSISDKEDDDMWSIGGNLKTDIIAYQTNRTKVAKFEWLECDECFGSGNLDLHSMFNTSADICTCCKGKGYRLEAVK